jgi:putative methyltransferase (TIGR04325 family)
MNGEATMLKQVIKRLLGRRGPVNSFKGVFKSFEEASRAIPSSQRVGYNVPETAEWYRKWLTEVQHDDYPMLYWFEKTLQDSVKVVEIGGHVGVAYYPFTRVMKCPEGLDWTIVDVPSVTEAGTRLAKERQATNLHFVTDLAQATNGCDVLLASGALQYLAGGLLPERVHQMPSPPRHIIINKTPVREHGDGYVTVQDIGVSFCPYRIHGRHELITPLERMGYEIVASWRKDRCVAVPGRADLTVEHYSGYYLRRAV